MASTAELWKMRRLAVALVLFTSGTAAPAEKESAAPARPSAQTPPVPGPESGSQPAKLQAAAVEQGATQQDASASEERPNPCEQSGVSEVPVLDSTKEMLQENLCSAALWVDGLFGEEGDVQAAQRTHGYVELSNYYSQFEGYDLRTRLRVEVDLPTLENRLSAFIGRENDEEFVRGRSDAYQLRSQFPSIDDEDEWLAGLGYSLPGRERLQTRFRVGVRGLANARVFAQGRLRYHVYSDLRNVVYVNATPFWNSHDKFGFTQSLDVSRVLSPTRLLRWYSVGTVSERSEGLNWRHSLIHYQNLRSRRGLAYEVFIRGETDEPEPLYEYGLRTLFRHPTFKRRLYFEWAAGYSWPRVDPALPREGSYNGGLSLELPFGIEEQD